MKLCYLLLLGLLAAPQLNAYDNVSMGRELISLSFKNPAGVAASGDRVFVADSKNNSLVIFSGAATLPEVIGATETGLFNKPEAVAVGPDGRIYVADTGASRVQVLDAKGKLLFTIGSKGSQDGQFSQPKALAVSASGRLFVADTGNSRIQVFSPDGILLYAIKGAVSSPVAVAVDRSERLYVQNKGDNLIMKLDAKGGVASTIAVEGSGFCVDDYGFIYTFDAKKGKIREYAPDGKFLGAFGTSGKGPGQLAAPSAITANGHDNLLVADPGNRRVIEYIVQNDLKQRKLPLNSETRINLYGPEKTYKTDSAPFAILDDGTLAVYNQTAKHIELLNDKGALAGTFAPAGKEPGQSNEPEGLAYAKKTGIIVADTGNSRVEIFTATGAYKTLLGEKGTFFGGDKEGRMDEPEDAAICENGNIFVADTGNARIQQFSPRGMFINAIGPDLGNGIRLENPVSVKCTRHGVIVLDADLKKVFRLQPSGQLINAWGEAGEDYSKLCKPAALAYDGRKYVYLLDSCDSKVKVFDAEGKWITSFFAKGSGAASLLKPARLEFYGDTLYISDPGNSRIAAYRMEIKVAPPLVAATTKDDKVTLKWTGMQEDWTDKYIVYRSTSEKEGFQKIGDTEKLSYTDTLDDTFATYYYQITALSRTGAEGNASSAQGIFVQGSMDLARLDFEKIDLEHIFSANYKYYLTHPVGTLVVANNTDVNFRNVKLSFALKDFMDFPYDTVIKSIAPHSKAEVPLMATLNNKILDVNEDTPIQSQLTLTYYEKRQQQVQTINKPLKVLSRYAIIWDRPDRLANFVTPKDPPAFKFGRAALLMKPKTDYSLVNPNIASALIIWSALSEMGVSYLPDPANPYEKIKSNSAYPLDTVQLPRDTLKLKSGECDDLTALLATLFEGAGLQTALLDYPSHIALMFDTRETDAEKLGIPENMLVRYNDTLWVPVEATMIGKNFTDSSRQALSTYTRGVQEKNVRVVELAEAWKEFEPVTMPETQWEAPMPDAAGVLKRYSGEAKQISDYSFDYLKGIYETALKADPADKDATESLGILYAQTGDTAKAAEYFNGLLTANPADSEALSNMGNLSYMKGDYAKAEEFYSKAVTAAPGDDEIWLNRARAAKKAGNDQAAKDYAAKALELNPETKDMGQAIVNMK